MTTMIQSRGGYYLKALDVMGIQVTHTKGCGVMDCAMRSESEVLEGMKRGLVWCGVDNKSKKRGEEGCVLLISPRVWEGIKAHGWKSSSIVWIIGKIGKMKHAWVCEYVPVNVRSGKGR